jgi:adenine-specific DNA-methyltransferase
VASLLASCFDPKWPERVRLLDPGAGVGSLTAAFLDRLLSTPRPPKSVHVTLWEVDRRLARPLEATLAACRSRCADLGIAFHDDVRWGDFIEGACGTLALDGLLPSQERYSHAILNPPYAKIRRGTREDRLLRTLDVEVPNLYAAFLALAVRLLEPEGEVVAITPRSFCNGPYFGAFRRGLLRDVRIRAVHTFERRDAAFTDDTVLQENVVVHAMRTAVTPGSILLTSLHPEGGTAIASRRIRYADVVRPDDRQAFIRLPLTRADGAVAERMHAWSHTLADLGIQVSTGRVVDFRSQGALCGQLGPGTVPLLYALNLRDGRVAWPATGGRRKPQALKVNEATDPLLIPPGPYVLVKRFSAKEEARRVVAGVLEPGHVGGARVGIENHLNYLHSGGEGLPLELARGVAAFLNSSMVDTYFRQFNGHTQVNATDLRSLRVPPRSLLIKLARVTGVEVSATERIDAFLGDA